MADVSNNPITSLSLDWAYDPINGKKFSGASVQAFIKSYLGVVSQAAYFNPNNYTMYWFATEEDRDEFINSGSAEKVLYSVQMDFSSEMRRIALVNNNGNTTLNYATNAEEIMLSVSFDVQRKEMSEPTWQSTGDGAYVDTFIDVGATGNYETLYPRTFLAAETDYNVDVREALNAGVTRIKIQFTSENDSSVIAAITYTINMTEMFIEPLNNEWYKPIVEGGDVANYKLGGFRIVGAVNKTLHLDIYSGDTKLLSFERLIGQTVYDRVPYYYTQADGFDISELGSGVYLVSAYLTSGSITSLPVNYTVIHIAQADINTAQYVCINEVQSAVYNYTTSKLFSYSVYNEGQLTATPIATVKQINGTSTASTRVIPLTDVSTSEAHDFLYAVEWLTEDSLNLYLQTSLVFGNEQVANVPIDNSVTFPPTYGYDMYMNAASRSNSDENLLKFVNIANNVEYTPTWERMAWIDGIDGWTEDLIGRRCLYLPAGSRMTLPWGQFKFLNGAGITFEICYRVANVSDYDENVITIADNPLIAGFRGIRIRPTNITVHSSADNTDTYDLARGTNVSDESVIHFTLTIFPNYGGNAGRNLVTGYVNGSKAFQFDYESGSIWEAEADLVAGGDSSDVSIYFIRRYNSVLAASAVQANYINSLRTIAERTELSELFKSVMDASQTDISYESVKNNNYNFFVLEMANGASVPSRANGWSKERTGLSSLEMHYGLHPDWDWRIEGVETGGQGTTSMNYYRWNIRWRIDKTSGKKVDVKYLTARRQRAGSYIYDWSEPSLQGSINFDGADNHPAVKRITAKTNAASSMQDHKIGATRAYTELHDALGLQNEAQKYAELNDEPIPTVSVYQYPAFGFVKEGDYYTFIGLFTIGPDKGDKSTFGMDISSEIKNNLISMEGTDHSRKMVMFNYPWNNDVQYLASNECINIVKGASDYDNGWEVGNAHGLGTDEPDDQAAINTVINTEFKPAYNVAYENSTLILGIPLGVYGATAEATLSYINSNVAVFQAQVDQEGRFTYANYQFWIEGEYVLYYYDIVDNIYKPSQDLVEQNGSPLGDTVDEQNEWFKTQRRNRFRTQSQDYWDIPECIYHYAFIIFIGAMDNFGKNTYPYKMKTLANGGKWKWWQDDLDSIIGIGNAGADNMPTWMEFEDSDNGSVYFGGSTSVFWNLIHECFMEDYINTTTDAIRPGILSMGKSMLEAMSNISGGANVYDGVMLYLKQRFWDNAQNYFPQSAYNADAAFKYEAAWLANGQEVAPLSQSLGNHYSAEELWLRKRVIYMMSLFRTGPFGSYADTSLGQIAFRPQSLQSLTVTPESELYPAFASGQGMVSTARTQKGEEHTFVGPFGVDGQTSHYINASHLLKSLGDLKDLRLGAQYINPLQVQGKKLVVFKIGDAVAEEVTTNVPGISFDSTYCLEEIDARNAVSLTGTVDISECTRLRRAYFEGTSITQVRLKNGQKLEVLHYSDGVTNISIRNVNYLSELRLPQDVSAISLIDLINVGLNPYDILTKAYLSDNSYLRYVNIYDRTERQINYYDFDAILGIANGLDKDGGPITYAGVNNDGSPAPTAPPVIDGIINASTFVLGGYLDFAIESEEDYTGSLKKALSRLFNSNLYIIYDPTLFYPDPFVDDGWIWCYYNVTTTESATQLIYASATITGLGANFIIDGEEVSQTKSYTFSTTGVHLVKIQRTGATPTGLFRGITTLKRAYLPSTITSLSERTFSGATGLTHLWISRNVTALGTYCMNSTTSLRVVNLHLQKVTSVGQYACDGALLSGATLDLPALTSLSTVTFRECSFKEIRSLGRITTIPVPSGNAFGTFRDNTALKKVTLPETLTSIASYAFSGCTNIETINLSLPNVTSIGSQTFRTCGKMKVAINFPSLTSIGQAAFYGSGITKIESLGSITSLPAPSSGSIAIFATCASLTEVILPSTITNIGNYTFSSCSALRSVTCLATTPPTLGATSALPGTSVVQHIYVPAESVEAYQAATNWSAYASKISAIPEE